MARSHVQKVGLIGALLLGVGLPLGSPTVSTALAAAAGPQAPDPAGASVDPDPSAPVDPDPSAPVTRVSYGGVDVEVPAGMPVIDLDAHPRTCLRLDVSVVYVGSPGEEQVCPAHAVGRASTIWIGPKGAAPTLAPDPESQVPGRSAERVRSDVSHKELVVLPESEVAIQSTWKSDSRAVDQAIASISADGVRTGGGTAATHPAKRGPVRETARTVRRGTTAGRLSAPTRSALTNPVGRPLSGMAFDTCSAPSVAAMRAWRASPYAAVGIYIGGSMRACGDGNLSASWVDQVAAQGWGLIPIYVGRQAPCVSQPDLAVISTDAATARAQGTAAASDGVAQAQRFGLGVGSTLWYDMEGYATGNAACSAAVTTFMSAWTTRLKQLGYNSGAYGGLSSLMADMSRQVSAGTGFMPPDSIWIAHWNNLQTTRDTYTPQYLPDGLWVNHQRMRQYGGDRYETWGGVGLHIDPNWADATIPGNPTQTSYETRATGPGGAGFVFTGSMNYWRSAEGKGSARKAYWTRPSGSAAESNGATWSMDLPAGSYRVEANVPESAGATSGRYTVSGGGSTSTRVVDQSTAAGWRPVGQVTLATAGRSTVHLGDNASSDTSRTIWADAVRWTPLSATPTPTPTPTPSPTPSPTATSGAAATTYHAHVQNLGWMPWVADGQTAGTVGASLRLEALGVQVKTPVSGGIRMRAHVQNYGWMPWVGADSIIGTLGQGLRLEALEISLTGEAAARYSLQYRAHVQNIGWQNWVSDGATAGTVGRGLRVEAVSIRLVPKA